MCSTLLCVALLVQVATQPSKSLPYPAPAVDWAFMQAQEESLMGFLPPGNRAFLAAMPPEVATHLLRMDSQYSKVRLKHRDALRAMGPDAARWLFRGRHMSNEVRDACEFMLTDFAACKFCHGVGRIANTSAPEAWWYDCVYCWRMGTFWPTWPFIVERIERNYQ